MKFVKAYLILALITACAQSLGYGVEALNYEDQATYELSKYTVTAREIPFSFDYVYLEEYEKPFRHVSDVLQSLPTVFVQGTGEGIQAALPLTLGSENTHTRIIFDGIVLNTQLDGIQDISLIDMNVLKGVGVSNGPLSAQWGSSLGGVLHFTSRDADSDMHAQLSGSYGRWNSGAYSMTLPVHKGDTTAYLTASHQTSDGFRDDGDARRTQYFIKSKTRVSDTQDIILTGLYSLADIQEYSIPLFRRTSHLDTDVFLGSVTYRVNPEVQDGIEGKILLHGIRAESERQYYLTGDTDRFLFANFGEESGLGIRANLILKKDDYQLGGELNWDHTSLESSSFADDQTVEKGHAAIQAQSRIWEKLNLTAAFRFDIHDAFDNEWSGQLGAVYDLGNSLLFKFTVSHDYNTPPLAYLFTDQPERLIRPNVQLNPEMATTYQCSIEKYWNDSSSFQVTFFEQKLQDGLTLIYGTDGFFQYRNVSEFTRSGINANFGWKLNDLFETGLGASYNEVQDEITDAPVAGRGRLKMNGFLNVKMGDHMNIYISTHYIWWDMPSFFNAEDRNFIWDVAITRHINQNFDVKLSMYNVFDEELYWVDLFPNTPGYIEGSLRYVF